MSRSLQNYLAAFLLLGSLGVAAWAGPANVQEAIRWLNKAVASYDKDDFVAANRSLKMALQTEPNFSEAYLLKGLLEYHDGQTDKAAASWKRAPDLINRMPSSVRERLDKKTKEVGSNLTEQDFSHFRLQFHGADQRDQAWQAVKSLDDAYNDLGSRFGVMPDTHFVVIIFTSDEFWEAWNAPAWLGGFFDSRDGRIRVRIDSTPGGEEEFQRRLRHEFTHAFINYLYPKDLPVWFQEGVAQFYAYASPSNGLWKDIRLDDLKKSLKNAPWMDLQALERMIRKKDGSAGQIYLAYLESEALVLSIAKDRGDSWIPAMMERLRGGATFEAAFKEVVGVTPAEALENLHHSLS